MHAYCVSRGGYVSAAGDKLLPTLTIPDLNRLFERERGAQMLDAAVSVIEECRGGV